MPSAHGPLERLVGQNICPVCQTEIKDGEPMSTTGSIDYHKQCNRLEDDFYKIIRHNIQKYCEKMWPGSPVKAGSLCREVTKVTGRSSGLHAWGKIINAYDTGICCLLLLRDIARALNVSMDDLLPNDKDQWPGRAPGHATSTNPRSTGSAC
jgi:hypothetical protein